MALLTAFPASRPFLFLGSLLMLSIFRGVAPFMLLSFVTFSLFIHPNDRKTKSSDSRVTVSLGCSSNISLRYYQPFSKTFLPVSNSKLHLICTNTLCQWVKLKLCVLKGYCWLSGFLSQRRPAALRLALSAGRFPLNVPTLWSPRRRKSGMEVKCVFFKGAWQC